MTQQLRDAFARCRDCDRSCDKKNAQAWAHNHARAFGHAVDVQLVYFVAPEGGGPLPGRADRPGGGDRHGGEVA